MSGDTLSIGLIGCGRAGVTYHLPALSRLPGVRVVALADIDEGKVNAAGSRFGVKACFTDYRRLLDLTDLDAVAICTPTLLHVPMALDALSANKHMLVEKPVGLDLSAIETLQQAAAATDRKITVGFVMRHHRLLRQARAAIALGMLGTIEAIHTHWTVPVQFQANLPEWRTHRATGGGALIDFAVHHIDLWRYLMATEIESITTQTTSGFSEDQTVTLSARLCNGTLANSTISEASRDSQEIHIFGHLGTLHISCYRFDGLSFEPTFAPASASRQWLRQIETLAHELPQGVAGFGTGGEYGRAFGNEWASFVESIRTNKPLRVTLNDGVHASAALLAAVQSAEESRPVHVANTASQLFSEPSLPSLVQLTQQPVQRSTGQLSVIVITPDNFESIQALFNYLKVQTVADRIELVIVAPGASWLHLDERQLEPFANYHVVELPSAPSIGAMQAAGLKAATAPIVVFSEEHCFPAPDWAEKLIAAHQDQHDQYAAVSPVVRNANPYSHLSWADAIISYGPWLEPVVESQIREVHYLPWHHTSYKRSALDSFGDELNFLLEVPNVLQDRLRQSGQTFLVDPSIRISHVQITRFRVWLRVQYLTGRLYASHRCKSWSIARRLFYAAAAPLIPVVRVWRSLRILWRDPTRRMNTFAVGWRMLIGLSFSAFGEFMGYLFGTGKSRQRHIRYEFSRWRDTMHSDWVAFHEALEHIRR